MLRASIIFSVFVLQIFPLAAQGQIDKVYTFRFRFCRDMFYVPYAVNEMQLESLLTFVGQHKEEILNRRIILYVNGYCNSLSAPKANLAIAKLRSNRVKSELIVRRGIKENCFVTRNHAENGDYVTVSVCMPVSLADTLAISSVASPIVPSIVPLDVPPSAYPFPSGAFVQNQLERETPCKQVSPVTPAVASPVASSQSRLALKTNLLYWAALMFNAEAELYFKSRWSVNLDYQYAWISRRSKHKYYRLAAVSPELRYWFASKENFRGHFGGIYIGTGLYEFMARPTHGIQGEFFIAGGLTYGYMFPIGRRLRMELSLGVGYMLTEYRQYHWDRGCYVYEKTQRYSYFGPTKAKVSLVWPLNLFKRKPRIET